MKASCLVVLALLAGCHHDGGGGGGGGGASSSSSTTSATSATTTASSSSSSTTSATTTASSSTSTGSSSSTGGSGGGDAGTPTGCRDAQWLKSYGDAQDQYADSVALDASGNILLAGHFQGTLDLGSGVVVTSPGSSTSVYVAKLDATGHALWAKAFPPAYQDTAVVTTDAAGNVIVGGEFLAGVDFGGGPVASGGGIVVKLSPSGAFVWNASFPALSMGHVETLAVDPGGNILAGLTYVVSTTETASYYLAKLDPAGSSIWATDLPHTGAFLTTVRADSGGNVYFAGLTTTGIDIPPGKTVANGVFLFKLDAAGNALWSQGGVNSGGITNSILLQPNQGLVVDAAGAPYVTATGTLATPNMYINFGSCMVSGQTGGSGYLAKADPATGACQWATLITAYDGGGAPLLGIDDLGHPLTFNASGGTLDIWTPSGTLFCEETFPGVAGGASTAFGLAASTSGELLLAGAFQMQPLSFGGTAVSSAGMHDVFVAKF